MNFNSIPQYRTNNQGCSLLVVQKINHIDQISSVCVQLQCIDDWMTTLNIYKCHFSEPYFLPLFNLLCMCIFCHLPTLQRSTCTKVSTPLIIQQQGYHVCSRNDGVTRGRNEIAASSGSKLCSFNEGPVRKCTFFLRSIPACIAYTDSKRKTRHFLLAHHRFDRSNANS